MAFEHLGGVTRRRAASRKKLNVSPKVESQFGKS